MHSLTNQKSTMPPTDAGVAGRTGAQQNPTVALSQGDFGTTETNAILQQFWTPSGVKPTDRICCIETTAAIEGKFSCKNLLL